MRYQQWSLQERGKPAHWRFRFQRLMASNHDRGLRELPQKAPRELCVSKCLVEAFTILTDITNLCKEIRFTCLCYPRRISVVYNIHFDMLMSQYSIVILDATITWSAVKQFFQYLGNALRIRLLRACIPFLIWPQNIRLCITAPVMCDDEKRRQKHLQHVTAFLNSPSRSSPSCILVRYHASYITAIGRLCFR